MTDNPVSQDLPLLPELAIRMGQFMEAAESEKSVWSDDELASLLEHQLAAGLLDDLALFFDEAEGEVARSGLATFDELFSVGDPPVSLLRMTRQLAKKLSGQPERFPADVALVLYYTAIAAAQVRAGASITSMSHDDLRKGYAWACGRAWLPPRLIALLEQAQT